MAEVNLPLVIGASLIDGINPCAFGVLIFLLAYLAKTTKKKSKMLVNGSIYIAAVFITYLIAGLLLLNVIEKLGKASVAAYWVIAIVIFIAGLIEIKDYFWYGQGFSLTILPSQVERIKHYVTHVSDKPTTAFFMGVFVALVELPCTGAVYLAVLALMSKAGVTTEHVGYLVLYNFIFVLPLFIILFLVYKGMSTESFHDWKEKHKGMMRLITGLLLIGLAVWMILSLYY